MKNLINLFLFYILATSISPVSAQEDDRFKVGILLFDQVQIIDFAAPYEVFGHAGFDIYTVSPDGAPITTVMDLKVSPDYSFDTLPKMDAILIPGGTVREIMMDERVQKWVQYQHSDVSHVLSVCTGSYILAETGLLDGLTATTFHMHFNRLANDYPEINVTREARYTDNGKIITSAGLSSGVDAALHLVSKVQGLERAKTIAMVLEYDWNNDNGFVRGTMADRHYPQNHYTWPADMSASNSVSYGDQTTWHRSVDMSTSSGEAGLLKTIRDAMNEQDTWTQIDTPTTNAIAWQKAINGALWQVKYAVSKTLDGTGYKLESSLVKLN